MSTKNKFTLGFLPLNILTLWVISAFARDTSFTDLITILCAVVGGIICTLALRAIVEKDSSLPKGPSHSSKSSKLNKSERI